MDIMDKSKEGEEPQIPRTTPHRMSIQCHAKSHVEEQSPYPQPSRKSKSLPNIQILGRSETPVQCITVLSTLEPEEGSKRDLMYSHGRQQHQSIQQKPKILKKTWDKVKTIIHTPSLGSSGRKESLRKSETRAPLQRSNALQSSAPSTPMDNAVFEFEESCTAGGDEVIARNYALLQKRLSEELHQRMSECSKSSGNVGGDDGARALHHGGGNRFPEHLSDEFRKKLQSWEMWKASTGRAKFTDEELREIVPETFAKKLYQWEVIRSGGQLESVSGEEPVVCGGAGGGSEDVRIKSSKRKFNFGGSNTELPQTQHQRELAWLDKQLEKIEGEKKRLEREMNKYLEKEARLEKMKQALKNSPSTDVYIKTPTAKCRVEKITEKFAKKLYEWEEKQGIGPESSTLGLLHPKYYAEAQEEAEGGNVVLEGEFENKEVLDKEGEDKEGGCGEGDVDDEEEILGPLDLINARLKAAEEEETEQEKSVRLAMEHVAEALALADEEVVGIVREGDGRVSSTASSCCCSAEYEYDQTDSFATKNNSGASNTDSEFYSTKPDPNKLCTNNARRRSSDAISTPLSGDARSPSLSAFTSDDEGDANNGPLLRRVSEEDDAGCSGGGPSVSRHSTMRNATAVIGTSLDGEQLKDAESQTEVILRAKQILVEDEDSCGNDERAWDSANGIFVPTKRTIFAPIVGEVDSEKVVLIREDTTAGEGSLTRRRADDVGDGIPARFSAKISSTVSIPSISSPGFGKQDDEEDEDDKPRIVDMIPKRPTHLNIRTGGENQIPPHPYKPQPKTQLHRSFPKMGKIPVWCSPLVARKQMFSSNNNEGDSPHQQQGGAGGGSVTSGVSVTTPDDSDFSIDRFLQDSKLLDAAMNACVAAAAAGGGSNEGVSQVQECSRAEGSKRPVLCSRLPKTNAFLPSRKKQYTIGGGFPPTSGCVLTRSNSFGYPKRGLPRASSSNNAAEGQHLQPPGLAGSNITLESFSSAHLRDEGGSTLQSVSATSMHSVTKSKSTGSIKSKFGRAFARVGFGFGKEGKGGNKLPSEKSEDVEERDQESFGQDEGAGGMNSPGSGSGGGERGGTRRRESSGGATGEASGLSGFAGMNPLRRFGSWVSRVGGGSFSGASGGTDAGGNKATGSGGGGGTPGVE